MAAHFEIHVSDVSRAKNFYHELFGWNFEPMQGGDDMDYHLIEGEDIGEPHGLTGGLIRRMGPAPQPGMPIRGATITFEVADADRTYETALLIGGAEALPPEDYPGVGRVAYVEDGEGNVVGFISSPKKGD